jgi:predicted nucleic acid-binding protein
MRLVDANILAYAFTTSFAHHEPARAWLAEQLSASIPLGLPWPSSWLSCG